MAQRSVFTYAWDIADEGVSAVAEELRSRHINSITLAGAYHAGKFLRPHGKSGKVYFPEDGTVYFRPDRSRYGKIGPVGNSLTDERDIFAECLDLPDMSVRAWIVLLHNTLLGSRHPEACVANAFGDRYVYSLCPSNPDVREFAVNLCADIADRYALAGLTIESPGFAPFAHGYHHEFSLVRHNVWLDNLLGLCFCDHCTGAAAGKGIDAQGLRGRVASAVEDWLQGDVDFPQDMAQAFWMADIAMDEELPAFMRWRCGVVESLVTEIRAAVRDDAEVAIIPSVARPTGGAWYEGSNPAALAGIAGRLEVCFYEPGVDRIRADLMDVARRCGGVERIRAILRPGPPDLESRDAVRGAVQALHAAGIEDIGFYNYGHLKRSSLDWMGDALSEVL